MKGQNSIDLFCIQVIISPIVLIINLTIMSFKHINCNMDTAIRPSREQPNGVRSARHSVAAACESSRLPRGRGAPLLVCSNGMAGSSAGSIRERRNGGAAGADVGQRTSAAGGRGQGGVASSHVLMKAYYEEKPKNQNYQSPAGGASRRSGRNRPGLSGAAVGHAKSNRIVDQTGGNAPRAQRGAPQKAVGTAMGAKKSAANHGVPAPCSSGAKAPITFSASSSSFYQSQQSQPQTTSRNNLKGHASEFSTVVAQHKRVKSNSSSNQPNGGIARKSQQKLIASTFNTLCGEQPQRKMAVELQARPKLSSSKGRRPGPPEIIRPPKLPQPLTPQVAAGKQPCLQQLYWDQEDEEERAIPAELANGLLEDEREEDDVFRARSAGTTQARATEQTCARSTYDVFDVVETLKTRVAELEQQLEEERQDNIEKDIQIQQLLEIVKLKDLQIKEYQIEKAMATTMRKQQARTSLLDLDRQSSLMKQVGQTTGSCTHEQESREDVAGAAARKSGSNGEVGMSRAQLAKDTVCNQSALTTTLNLDDGALSAENAMVEMNAQKQIVDGSEPDDIGLQKDLVARKVEGRRAQSNLQECLTQQNSEKSTKNNFSDTKDRIPAGDGDEVEQYQQIDELEDLDAVSPEEPPQPSVNVVRPTQLLDEADDEDDRRQLLGGCELPEDYIQANFFDLQTEIADYSQHCSAVEMVPEPQIIDQRDFLTQNRLLLTLQPPQTSSTVRRGSPHQSQASAWHAPGRYNIVTTKLRSPEEEWQDSSKSSLDASKSSKDRRQAPDSGGQHQGQPVRAPSQPKPHGLKGASSTAKGKATASQQVLQQHRSVGALPAGPCGENEYYSVKSLNLGNQAKPQSLQEGRKPAGCPTTKSPLAVRAKNAPSWRKSSGAREPKTVSNHLQYQTQSALLLASRSSRKHQTLSHKPHSQCAKVSRTTTGGAQGRPGGYLNHLQKQYGNRTSLLASSSAAASSTCKSLDKVAVNVPNIPTRSPAAQKNNSGPDATERTPEGRAHSFRIGYRPELAEKATSALDKQSSAAPIQHVQDCNGLTSCSAGKAVPAKSSQSFVETSKRSPISHLPNGRDSATRAGHGGQVAPNTKPKAGQKVPPRREPPQAEPPATQRGAQGKVLQGIGKETAGGGSQRGGLVRRKASEHNGGLESKNQTQKLTSRKLGMATPRLSQRGGASARQAKQSQSTIQIQGASSAALKKVIQPSSGQKVHGEGQGLAQRLLNTQRISTCRLGPPSSRMQPPCAQLQNQQLTGRTKTAITEPIVERQQSAASHRQESLSEQSKQLAKRVDKVNRINKNEILFQQVLRKSKERQRSGLDLQEQELEGRVGPAPCEYSQDEDQSCSERSQLLHSRISLRKSSQHSQSHLQMNAEKERSHYLDRTLPRNDAALWAQAAEPAQGATHQDGADDEGWYRQGHSSQALYGPVPAVASAAPSDSASQCNYRTREEATANGQLSSQASGNISCGGGHGAAQASATTPTSLAVLNSYNPALKSQHQRGESTQSANQQHDGQTFDYARAHREHGGSGLRLGEDFNLLSPYDLRPDQDLELLNDSSVRRSSEQNTWAPQQSLQHAVQMQLTHREHRLPVLAGQQSSMLHMVPQNASEQPMYTQQAHHSHQFACSTLPLQPPALYTLQNSTDFDVIYEKNSTEEMENSVLSKSRMSKVSRVSRLCPEAQSARPDSQLSVALPEQQLAINLEQKDSSRGPAGQRGGRRYGPTLSGELPLGPARATVSCDWLRTDRVRRSSATDFEHEGVLGTNYESAGIVDGVDDAEGSFRKDLCDQSLQKEAPKSSQAPSSNRTRRVFELRDAIKRDQENFLMEEILAPNTERTPGKQRRSRSQRRGQPSRPSTNQSPRGKRDYCTQAHDAAAVHPFDGCDATGPATRAIPCTARRPGGASKSKLSGGVLGSRAPEKRRGTDASGATSEHQATPGALKANEQSVERVQPHRSPAQPGLSHRSGEESLQGDDGHDSGETGRMAAGRSRQEIATNVQAAQDCLEVLDQSLHNFLVDGTPEEPPRTPEGRLGRQQEGTGDGSSSMAAVLPQSLVKMEDGAEGVAWQGSLLAQRVSSPARASRAVEQVPNAAATDSQEANGPANGNHEAQNATRAPESARAGPLRDGTHFEKAILLQDATGQGRGIGEVKAGRSPLSSPRRPRDGPENQSNIRTSNVDADNHFFKMENDGFYAYSGAFETFNKVARPGAWQVADGQHSTALRVHTSTEGSFVRSERSPTGLVLSPGSQLAGASANQQHPGGVVMSASVAEKVTGKPESRRLPSSRATGQADHNISVMTLQNLPPASQGNIICSTGRQSLLAAKGPLVSELLKKMPGVFYQMVSELLGEKLPLIIFTNRQSFKVSLDTMISCYANCQAQIAEHKEILRREISTLQRTEMGQHSSATGGHGGVDMDRYLIATIPEEDCDPQPSNSQHDSAGADIDASSTSPRRQPSQCQPSSGRPEFTEEQLEGELLEITLVEQVYDGIVENIKHFRGIVL